MADTNPITIFGLIRHAQTVWNQEKRIQGRSDTPLTAQGASLAEAWGRRLAAYRWDRMIVSTSGRALKTAELINISLRIPMMEDSRLQEQDWGEWTGKTVAQLVKDRSVHLSEHVSAGWRFCPPSGEDRNEVWKRSQHALKKAAEKWPGKRILVVTHEGVIKCLIYRLNGRRFLPTEPPLLSQNQLHLLTYDGNGLRIKEINAFSLG